MRKLITGVLVSAVASGGILLSSPAWAACGLGADNPVGGIAGTGSRSGCSGTVTLDVYVKKDVSLSTDPTAAHASRTNFGNGSLTASGSCQGHGSYYTETRSSSGNKIQSGRVTRC